MRHVFANRITFLIAILLVLAAVLFAYVRSAEIVIVPEEQLDADVGQDEPIEDLADFEWETLGDGVYSAQCAGCHGSDGTGQEGLYPSLRGHAADLFLADDGRSYLIELLVHGIEGEIEIMGITYDDLYHESSFAEELDDREIAAVLNTILTEWGNRGSLPGDPSLYLPGEVAEERQQEAGPDDVLDDRPDLAAGDR